MFLRIEGVTGEAGDADHKGEIEVVAWSWGMEASVSVATGLATGKMKISELLVVKRVDHSSPTLMNYLKTNKKVKTARLTVRKAGTKPLEYFWIDIEDVRVTAIKAESENTELVERLRLGFAKVKVSYTPQDALGGVGGGTNVFETNALESTREQE